MSLKFSNGFWDLRKYPLDEMGQKVIFFDSKARAFAKFENGEKKKQNFPKEPEHASASSENFEIDFFGGSSWVRSIRKKPLFCDFASTESLLDIL